MEKYKALELLGKTLKSGDHVYTVVKRISNSGQYRHIDFYVFKPKQFFEEGENQVEHKNISKEVAHALGFPFKDKTGCVGVQGDGMDMGKFVVQALQERIFGDDGKLIHVPL